MACGSRYNNLQLLQRGQGTAASLQAWVWNSSLRSSISVHNQEAEREYWKMTGVFWSLEVCSQWHTFFSKTIILIFPNHALEATEHLNPKTYGVIVFKSLQTNSWHLEVYQNLAGAPPREQCSSSSKTLLCWFFRIATIPIHLGIRFVQLFYETYTHIYTHAM